VKYLTEFQLQTGGKVIVEVDEPLTEGRAVQVSRSGDLVQKAKQTLDEAITNLKPAAEVVLQRLRSLDLKPDEIAIEFGIKLSAEAGAFIASASSEANFQISMKWSKEEKDK
jgi:NTP-dependent ternary system trypsin peptidase co-occuring protein